MWRRPQVEAHGAGDIVEAASAAEQVVGAAGGFDVFAVVAAGKAEVAFGGDVAGGGVVGDGIGVDDVVAVGEDDVCVAL